jgi:hypothetical protein
VAVVVNIVDVSTPPHYNTITHILKTTFAFLISSGLQLGAFIVELSKLDKIKTRLQKSGGLSVRSLVYRSACFVYRYLISLEYLLNQILKMPNAVTNKFLLIANLPFLLANTSASVPNAN